MLQIICKYIHNHTRYTMYMYVCVYAGSFLAQIVLCSQKLLTALRRQQIRLIMVDSTDTTDWEDSRFLNPRKDFTNGIVLILYRLFLACAITLDFFLLTLHGMSQPCSTSLFAAVLTASALLQCGWYALRKRQIPESLLKSLLSNTKSNCIGPQQPSKH